MTQPALRQVYVIQDMETGWFLHLDLYLTPLLRDAGRTTSRDVAIETAQMNCDRPYVIETFWEEEQ